MTSTWTPLGVDSESKVRTCFGRIYDLAEGGAVTEITGGTGISTGGTPSAPVIYNDGVLVVNAGPGITVSGDAQTPTVSNTGVLGVSAGTGIAVSGTQSDRAIANTGVLSVTAGTNISVTGTAQNPVVNSTLSIPSTVNWFSESTVLSTDFGDIVLDGPFTDGSGIPYATMFITAAGFVKHRQIRWNARAVSGGIGNLDQIRSVIVYVRVGAPFTPPEPTPASYMCAIEGWTAPTDIGAFSGMYVSYPGTAPVGVSIMHTYSWVSNIPAGQLFNRFFGAAVTLWPFSS